MVLVILGGSVNVLANERTGTVLFHIEAQDLGSALNEFALQSGKEIFFVEEELTAKFTSGISGNYLPVSALEQLLADTDISYRINDLDTILVGNQISVIKGERPAGIIPESKNVFQRFATGIAEAFSGNTDSSGTAIAAADEESEVMEEIVVTGIRGSLQQSLERKRNADHFVDAITAEDIGRFRIRTWRNPCSGSAVSPLTARVVRVRLSVFADWVPSLCKRLSAGVFQRPMSRREATMAEVRRTRNRVSSAFTHSSPGWYRRWKSTNRRGPIILRVASVVSSTSSRVSPLIWVSGILPCHWTPRKMSWRRHGARCIRAVQRCVKRYGGFHGIGAVGQSGFSVRLPGAKRVSWRSQNSHHRWRDNDWILSAPAPWCIAYHGP